MADENDVAQNDTEAAETTPEGTVTDQFYDDRDEDGQPESTDEGAETKTQEVDKADGEEETNVVDDGSSEDGNEDGTETDGEPDGEITIELGEDSLLAKEDVQRLEKYSAENKLSTEKATEVLGLVEKGIEDHIKRWDEGESDRNIQTVNEQGDKWKKATSEDKELGGENLKQTAALANRVINQYGSPELKKALDVSGLGNHPELVRMLSRIGKAGSDDTLGNDNLPPEEAVVSDGDMFYADTHT